MTGTVLVPSANSTGTVVRDVTAWPTGVPGLVVVPSSAVAAICDGAWSVLHARTGKRLPYCLPDPEGALSLAITIGGVTDWRQPGQAVRDIPATPAFAAATAVYEPWRCSHGPAASPDSMAHDNGVIA
jgi:hypothetical protein